MSDACSKHDNQDFQLYYYLNYLYKCILCHNAVLLVIVKKLHDKTGKFLQLVDNLPPWLLKCKTVLLSSVSLRQRKSSYRHE